MIYYIFVRRFACEARIMYNSSSAYICLLPSWLIRGVAGQQPALPERRRIGRVASHGGFILMLL